MSVGNIQYPYAAGGLDTFSCTYVHKYMYVHILTIYIYVYTRIVRLTGNPLPELISRANCVSQRVVRSGWGREWERKEKDTEKEKERESTITGLLSRGGRCQRAITNSEGGCRAATLYGRRRILHSVFRDTMGRGCEFWNMNMNT